MMFSIDLKDAYCHIPIQLDSWHYLRATLDGRVFQFKASCFDLSMTPQVFALVSKWDHKRGIRLLLYLDNRLIIAELVLLWELLLC